MTARRETNRATGKAAKRSATENVAQKECLRYYASKQLLSPA